MKKIIMTLLICAAVLPAWADVSPKPEMEFSFIYNTENKPLISATRSEQIQCVDNQCLEEKPLGHYGIQKLYCGAGRCFSVAYEYTDFQKLVIGFEDGSVRESNIFPASHRLRSRFNVYVEKDSLRVEPSDVIPDANAWGRTDAWVSLFIILLLEMLAAVAYLTYVKRSFKVLYSVLAVNLLTTTLCWWGLAWYVSESALLWLFCFTVEALLLRVMNLKRLSLKESFMLSLTINVTSYTLGMIISFILAPYLF